MKTTMMRCNEQVLPYLAPKARLYFEVLRARGLDPDFAMTLVESTMDEDEIYIDPAELDEEAV